MRDLEKGELRRTLSQLISPFESQLMYNPLMRGIPWEQTIAVGSLLLISARAIGGQEVKSPQPEKSKSPVKMEPRGRILGIGGVFFKSANRDQSREWYAKHLGLAGQRPRRDASVARRPTRRPARGTRYSLDCFSRNSLTGFCSRPAVHDQLASWMIWMLSSSALK